MIADEALREGAVLGPPRYTRIVGKLGTEQPHVLVIEGIPLAQFARDLTHDVINDPLRAQKETTRLPLSKIE